MKILLASVCVFSAFATALHATEVITIETPRNSRVEVLIDAPTTPSAAPTLLIAPGQGYHARAPLFERLAQAASTHNVTIVRFNWSYFVADPKAGKPSEKLALELEDMQAVMDYVAASPRFSKDRVLVAGKSLGSVVAWQFAQRHPTISRIVLLTPVCVDMSRSAPHNATLENYPGIEASTRSVAFILGDADPICPLPFIYATAARMKTPPRVGVVAGDHGFSEPQSKQPDKARDANIDLTVRWLLDFAAKGF